MTVTVGQRIQSLLDAATSRLTPEGYEDVAHYIQVHEWELAVHMLGEHLDEQDSKLSPSEWATFRELADLVGIAPDRFSWLRAEPK